MVYTYTDPSHVHAVTNLSNGNTYQYDANGNMSSRQAGGQTFSLTHDAENRLAQVSGAATASFVYDGDGKRILAIEGGTTTVFIGNYFEWSGTAVNAVRYYYAGTTRLAMRRGSGSVTWLLGDHLGSTGVSYDGTSELHQGYKPWGETRFGDAQTPYQFTGQYRQASLGLDFFNARWYDSGLGRFVQADSIIPEASQGVQAWDRYAGMNNNPVRYNDPTGHDVGCPGQDASNCGLPLPIEPPIIPTRSPSPYIYRPTTVYGTKTPISYTQTPSVTPSTTNTPVPYTISSSTTPSPVLAFVPQPIPTPPGTYRQPEDILSNVMIAVYEFTIVSAGYVVDSFDPSQPDAFDGMPYGPLGPWADPYEKWLHIAMYAYLFSKVRGETMADITKTIDLEPFGFDDWGQSVNALYYWFGKR